MKFITFPNNELKRRSLFLSAQTINLHHGEWRLQLATRHDKPHTHTHTDVKRLWWVYASLCAVKACLKLPWARKYKGNRTVITEACWAINSPVRHVRPVLTQEMKACYRDLTMKEQIKPFHRHLEATYDNNSSDSYRSKANWDEPYLLRDILRHPIYSFSLTSTYNV